MSGRKFYPRERGRLSREVTIWCGWCQHWDQISARRGVRYAIKHELQPGWKNTRAYGWLCPDCAASYNAGERREILDDGEGQ